MSLSAPDFDYIRDLAASKAGIIIDHGKEYLIEGRLNLLVKTKGYDSLSSLMNELKRNAGYKGIHAETVEALTINETSFFRDPPTFEYIKKSLLPFLIEKNEKSKRISIWSGASSTGQEIYSLVILIKEHFPELGNWNIEILATDLSRHVLSKAKQGIYTRFEVNRGLPQDLKTKYFDPIEGEAWQLREEFRSMVQFEELNLINRWPMTQSFDLILLRNVLIYFKADIKKRILSKVKERIAPHGQLILGSTETTINVDSDWRTVGDRICASYCLDDQN